MKRLLVSMLCGIIGMSIYPFFWWLSGHDFPEKRGNDLACIVAEMLIFGNGGFFITYFCFDWKK